MSTDQLTDAQVLAELLPDERVYFNPDDPMLDHDYPNWSNGALNDVVRLLALSRIEARAAAAREREAIAAMLADHARALQGRTGVQTQGARSTLGSYLADEIDALIVRIRARGGAA